MIERPAAPVFAIEFTNEWARIASRHYPEGETAHLSRNRVLILGGTALSILGLRDGISDFDFAPMGDSHVINNAGFELCESLGLARAADGHHFLDTRSATYVAGFIREWEKHFDLLQQAEPAKAGFSAYYLKAPEQLFRKLNLLSFGGMPKDCLDAINLCDHLGIADANGLSDIWKCYSHCAPVPYVPESSSVQKMWNEFARFRDCAAVPAPSRPGFVLRDNLKLENTGA